MKLQYNPLRLMNNNNHFKYFYSKPIQFLFKLLLIALLASSFHSKYNIVNITTVNGQQIFTPTTKINAEKIYNTPRHLRQEISIVKQELSTFMERKITDCYFNQKGRCAYQKLSYVFVSDAPPERRDCVLGCSTFSQISDQVSTDLMDKLSILYSEANETKIPIALVVIDILLATDVTSAGCEGLGELHYLMNMFTLDYTIIYNIHGVNKVIECANNYLIKYITNQRIYVIFSNINIRNTNLKGSVLIYDANVHNIYLNNVNDGVVMVNVNSTGTLKLEKFKDSQAMTSIFFDNVKVEVLDHFAFDNFGNIIICNSNIPINKNDVFSSITSVWLYQSVIRVTGYLLFQDVDEFVAYKTEILVVEFAKENLPILRVSYCKMALIISMHLDQFVGKVSLRIEQTARAAIIGLIVSNGIAGISGNNVQLRNIRTLYIVDSLFENNMADQSSLKLDQVSSLMMNNASFINNSGAYGAISYSNEENTYGTLSFFLNCTFIGNRATKAGGGAIYISYTPVMFSYCLFRDNYAIFGGAVYSRYGLHLEDSEFIGNKAQYSGGAIFAKDTLSVVTTRFLYNSILSTKVENCNREFCTGNGGAIYFDSATLSIAEVELKSNYFEGNSGISGGALAVRIFSQDSAARFINNTIVNNRASYSGGGVYYSLTDMIFDTTTNLVQGNKAINHGNEISTPAQLVVWDSGKDEMTLYPGQEFSLSPTFTDFVGSQYYNSKAESVTTTTKPEFFSLTATSDFKNMFITATNSSFIPTKITTKFTFLKTSTTLTINITPCPRGYSVNQANYGSYSSYICKENASTDFIIIVAVCVTVVVFAIFLLILSLCICGCVQAGRKVFYWVQRDKAEKDIEKRLLENDYISLKDETSINPQNISHDRKNNFVISIDQIFLEKKIGEGGSGVVYLGKWHHNAVAVKCLRIDTTSSGNMDSDEIEKEAALLCKLRHPNIVLFYGISISLHKQYLIVEYLERGSLEKSINEMRRNENPTQIPFIQKLQMLTDITCGMVYLHSLKIIHRDLKPANILMDSRGVCKVCDFGLSKIMSNTCHTTTTCVGTLFYIAPEVMKSDDTNDNNAITTAVDVFSFSIIMWEMFFEDNPYMNSKSYKIHKFHSNHNRNSMNLDPKTPFTVLARVMQGERPFIPFSNEEEKMEWLAEFMPEFKLHPNQQASIGLLVSDYMELMKSCWADDCRSRPNFETILNCLLLIKRKMQDICEKKNTWDTNNPNYVELKDV